MKQLSTLMSNPQVKNLAIGLGVSIVVPMAINLLVPVIRPLARSTLKAGILAYEKGRETVAEIGEVVDDLVAEVHEELQEAREQEIAAMDADTAAQASAVDRGDER